MNLLCVGGGKGSWAMRGQQLGGALGARVSSSPTEADLRWADVVVLVKRAAGLWADRVRPFGKPIVWDALDFWKQPQENALTEAEARRRLAAELAIIGPALMVGATEAMAQHARDLGVPATYLPHHSWAGLVPTAPRESVSVVAYEGNPVYLGSWLPLLQRECAKRGWTFVVNPPDLSKADMLVALRDGAWDGWMCRAWKSGVKLVNALAAGRPVITQDGAAWREIAPLFGIVVAGAGHISDALEEAGDGELRRAIARGASAEARRYRLDVIASRYRGMLASVTEAPCTA